MRKIILISIGILWILASACEDNDNEIQFSDTPIRLSGKILGLHESEAITRFRGGAGVGVYISDLENDVNGNLSAARVRNEKFMQSADGLVGDPLVYWKPDGRITVAAYYPYLGERVETSGTCSFSVAERQDTTTGGLSAYGESDFLWAKADANYQTDPVVLEFKHLMSKVIVYLKSDAMIPGDMIGSQVSILGMVTGATIDLETGTLTPEGQPRRIVATGEEMQKTGFEVAVKAIVVPQTVKTGVQWLDIKTLGGYSYTYELPEDFTFPSGKQITLDVSIESGECHVTVGDIEDWTETNNPIIGEAIEDLPVFELYDFYNLNGVQGLVIEIDETGKHGKLISLDETNTQWCTEPSLMAQAYYDDAQDNLEEVLKVDPTLEKFPAMKWCMDKNKDGITGWYMPALAEFKTFWNLLFQNKELINNKIISTGVPGATAIKTDWWETDGYFSSSLSLSDRVRCMCFNMFGNGLSTPLLAQDEYGDVRAFYKF